MSFGILPGISSKNPNKIPLEAFFWDSFSNFQGILRELLGLHQELILRVLPGIRSMILPEFLLGFS